jgi:hypothetical protein
MTGACLTAAIAVIAAAGVAGGRDGPPGVRVTIDAVHHELRIELGPLHVAGSGTGAMTGMSAMGAGTVADMGEMGAMSETIPRTVALGVNGWLEGYSVDLLDSAGRPLPRRLLHHVNLLLPQQRDLFSPIMLRLGALGSETPPVELPRVLGFRIHPTDSLLITAMLHNESKRPVTGARLIVHLRYVPATSWLHPLSIYPIYLDVMPPNGKRAYDLPVGHSERSWDVRPALSGRILALGAHVHRYAAEIRLEDLTAHEVIWRAAPMVDTMGEPIDMPVRKYWWRLGIPLSVKHRYRLTAVYNNPTGHMIPDGAMGAVGGVILPEHAEAWPIVDTTSAVFQDDRRVVYAVDADTADASPAELPTSAPGRMLTNVTSGHRPTQAQ